MGSSTTREDYYDGGTNSGSRAEQTQQGVVPGVVTGNTSTYSVNYTAPETADTLLDRQMMSMFGRRATASEKTEFRKQLSAAEKRYATRGGSSATGSTSKAYTFSTEAFVYEYATSLATNYVRSGIELGGEAGQTYNNLKSYAAEMGISLQEATAIQDALSVINGQADETSLMDAYRNRAIALYGGLAEQLKANPKLTVRQAAGDYINLMVKYLDVNPSTVDLQDNTLLKALTSTKDGKPYAKSLNEFALDLRNDYRFQYGTMAHGEAINLGQAIGRGFGAIA